MARQGANRRGALTPRHSELSHKASFRDHSRGRKAGFLWPSLKWRVAYFGLRPCAPARPVAHATAQRLIVRWLADQTAFSEPDVRFEARCGLSPNVAPCRRAQSHPRISIPLNEFPIRVFSNHFTGAECIEVATLNLHLLAIPTGAGEAPFRNAGLRFRIHK